MSADTKEILKRANFCLANKIPVQIDTSNMHGTFIPLSLVKRFDDKRRPIYEMWLADTKAKSSSVSVAIEDVDWPTSGGGYVCSE